MIKGIGSDIIEIKRIEKAICKEGFLKAYFTEVEIKAIFSKKNMAEKTSGIFAAKEAISKSMGTGFKGFYPKDIEIINDDSGKPVAIFYNRARDILYEKNIKNIYVSISHCKEYAMAYAVAEGE